ncbi:MAG TPA: hypothetical protein DEV80_12030, partial [Alcanivorax sp.]|nr:hypothetical protein [Alcanivorax sp.]
PPPPPFVSRGWLMKKGRKRRNWKRRYFVLSDDWSSISYYEDERCLKDPAPTIVVGELADSSVNFLCRPWVNSADYWPVKWGMTEEVKRRFDAAGIGIPYPQMDVHLNKPDVEG